MTAVLFSVPMILICFFLVLRFWLYTEICRSYYYYYCHTNPQLLLSLLIHSVTFSASGLRACFLSAIGFVFSGTQTNMLGHCNFFIIYFCWCIFLRSQICPGVFLTLIQYFLEIQNPTFLLKVMCN